MLLQKTNEAPASVSLAGFVRAIPPHCLRINPWRSWAALLRGAGLLIIAQYLLLICNPSSLFSPSALFLVPLWLFAGWALVGLFVLGHDCGHYSFSRNRLVNEIIGHVCFVFLMTGFLSWKLTHNKHHQKTQIRGEDPDWPEKAVTPEEFRRLSLLDRFHVRFGLGSPVGLLFGFQYTMLRRLLFPFMMPQMRLERKQALRVHLSNAFMVIVNATLLGFLFWNFSLWEVCKHYLIPAQVAMVTGAMLTFLHHTNAEARVFDEADWTPLEGQVLATYEVRFPRLLEWLWLDINIHLPHHVAPRIPWYHLREASAALAARFPQYHQSRPFRWSILWNAWRRHMLERRPGHYQMAAS